MADLCFNLTGWWRIAILDASEGLSLHLCWNRHPWRLAFDWDGWPAPNVCEGIQPTASHELVEQGQNVLLMLCHPTSQEFQWKSYRKYESLLSFRNRYPLLPSGVTTPVSQDSELGTQTSKSWAFAWSKKCTTHFLESEVLRPGWSYVQHFWTSSIFRQPVMGPLSLYSQVS